jgi:putative membrane protein
MKTTSLLLEYWNFNITAIVFLIILFVFHFITNGNRLSRKTPLFLIAAILYIFATLSSLDYLGKYFLFSAHMIQHILLLLMIPPLLLTSTRKRYLEKISINPAFRKISSFLFYPVIAWFLGVGSMWILHIPNLMMASSHSPVLMNLQVILLPVLGTIFVWPVFSRISWQKLPPLAAAGYLFLSCVGCTILGIMITFAPTGMFMHAMGEHNMAVADLVQANWGITPQADQMAAGLIMWVPACVIYLSFIIIILFRWFSGKGYDESEEELKKAKKVSL